MKNRKQMILFAMFSFLVFHSGCKDDFTPFMESEKDIMVYSIIDNRLPIQKAYLQRAFYDTADKKKLGQISLYLRSSFSTSKYYFNKSSIENDNYEIYTLSNDYISKRGSNYTMQLDTGKVPVTYATASVFLPLNPFQRFSIGFNETGTFGDGKYSLNMLFGSVTGNYYSVCSAFIEYEIKQGGKQFLIKKEIPYKIEILPDSYAPSYSITDYKPEDLIIEYPQAQYLIKNNIDYQAQAVEYAFEIMKKETSADLITIKRLYAYNYLIDANLYEKFIKEGIEISSCRFDEPFYYSNIIKMSTNTSGIGLLGYVLKDSIELKNSANIDKMIKRIGYKNDLK